MTNLNICKLHVIFDITHTPTIVIIYVLTIAFKIQKQESSYVNELNSSCVGVYILYMSNNFQYKLITYLPAAEWDQTETENNSLCVFVIIVK